jgi:PAS domain S-box-containing protein
VFDRLAFKLGISIAVILLGGLGAGFYLVYQHYWDQVLDLNRSHALIETRLIRTALAHQMLQNDRSLIREMVQGYATGGTVERVMVLDRQGNVQFSSDPGIARRHFEFDEPTCQVCHQAAPRERSSTITVQIGKRSVLRCVEPIPNEARCHSCHLPDHRINGVLIVDVPLEQAQLRLEQDVGWLALGTGGIGLLLLGAIGLVFRWLVLRRLIRFRETARAIAQGERDRRVPVRGQDALGQVELQFNRMADSVVGLLSQLEAQRAQLENVMNSVDDGLVVIDREHRVVAANQAFLRRFELRASELVGQRCCSAEGPKGVRFCPDESECQADRCFAGAEPRVAIRTRTASSGSVRHEEVLVSPIRTPEGEVSHCVEVWRDITERRSAEARLAETQRLASLGILASGFSHEVNTPLATIRVCMDGLHRLLSAEDAGTAAALEQVQRLVQLAAEQVGRCGAITEQFLQLARGKALSRDVVDLLETARMCIRLVEPMARQTGVVLAIDERVSGLSPVLANGPSVQQVLLNLLINAVEASRAGQTVRLRFVLERPEWIEVWIEDEGIGIAPADLTQVFEPFFSRRPNGTGLGLFVSKNFALGWGGDIRVESQVDVGTCFQVLFPYPEASKAGEHGIDPTAAG